jgi:hypothetical protein
MTIDDPSFSQLPIASYIVHYRMTVEIVLGLHDPHHCPGAAHGRTSPPPNTLNMSREGPNFARRWSRILPCPQGPTIWRAMNTQSSQDVYVATPMTFHHHRRESATETNGERVAITQILIHPRHPSNTTPS